MENTAKNRASDHTRHYVAAEQEQDYWSNKFGISKNELAAAIKAGESYTAAVEKYVKNLKLTT
ncbi:MAG: hypothetical protein JWQ79_3920 [Mucilaginibacter sp.]|jgi:hypothetical protein|nr:hypothetical protein [Mucilaginibacter sp.]